MVASPRAGVEVWGRSRAAGAMLERNPDEGRKALETILGGPLRFTPIETPDGKRYKIEGVIALETVVAVESNQPRAIQTASPAGFEPA
jgi:hypothetical protein